MTINKHEMRLWIETFVEVMQEKLAEPVLQRAKTVEVAKAAVAEVMPKPVVPPKPKKPEPPVPVFTPLERQITELLGKEFPRGRTCLELADRFGASPAATTEALERLAGVDLVRSHLGLFFAPRELPYQRTATQVTSMYDGAAHETAFGTLPAGPVAPKAKPGDKTGAGMKVLQFFIDQPLRAFTAADIASVARMELRSAKNALANHVKYKRLKRDAAGCFTITRTGMQYTGREAVARRLPKGEAKPRLVGNLKHPSTGIETTYSRALKCLVEDRPTKASDIAGALGASMTEVVRNLSVGVRLGTIERVARGEYKLTPKGAQVLRDAA